MPAANYNTRSPLPIQKSSDIYYRHIAAKGRGSPLWIPQANNQLPVEYQRIGTQIGDIGIITTFGGFDFLFNIFLPAGHAMQSEVLPQGFRPLDPLRPADVHGRAEFDRNSYLASSSIQRSQHDNDATGLTFHSSDSEGAVLAMPHGLNSRELSNVAVARQYLQDHLENIYRFANGTLGREVKNGDLCLVIGCDKTNAWGIATFARSTSQQELQLKFKPTETGSLGGSKYQWEYSGVAAEVRSGPGTQEVEQLRRHPDSNPFEHENQCLFIRTLNSVLSNDIWRRLKASKFGMFDVRESSNDTTGTPWKTNTPHSSSLNLDNSTNNTSGLPCSQSQEAVLTSEVDVALALHPSRHINNYLLYQNPNARMAITEDINWISVLEKDEEVLPPPDSMLKRVLQSYHAVVQDGIVYLLAKSTNKLLSPGVLATPYDVEDNSPENPTYIRENQPKFVGSHRRIISSSMSTPSTEPTSSSSPSRPSTTGTTTPWSSVASSLSPPIVDFPSKSIVIPHYLAQANSIKLLLNKIDETATTRAASSSRNMSVSNATVSASSKVKPKLVVRAHSSDRTVSSKPPPNIWHLRAEKMAAARAAGSSQNTSTPNDTAFPSRSQFIPQSSLYGNPWLTQGATSTANSAGLPPNLISSAAIATMNATLGALQDPKNWPELGKQASAIGKQAPSSSHPLRPSLPPPDSVLLSTSLNNTKPSNPLLYPWSSIIDETTTTRPSCSSRKANATVFTSSTVRPQLVVEAHGSDRTILSKPPPNIWNLRAEKMAAARASGSCQNMSISNTIALTSRSQSDSKPSMHGREKKWVAIPREELQAAADAVQRAPRQISSSNLRYSLHPPRPRHAPRRAVCPKSPKSTIRGLRSQQSS